MALLKIAFAFMTAAIQLVYSNDDIYLVGPTYIRVPEDVGTVPITIASRATETREAFIYFYFDYYGRLYDAILGDDYEFPNITMSSPFFNFTISPGATRSFDITIIDDNIAEQRYDYYYEEVIAFNIGVYVSEGRDYCGYFHIYIEDNDGLRFELLRDGITVEEDVGTVDLCITYRGDNVPPVIDAAFHERTYGDDIIFNTSGLVFSMENGDRMCFSVTIVDDNEIESMEYFYFRFDAINSSLTYSYFFDETYIAVTDNEAFRIGLESSSYSVLESDGVVTVCVTADRGDGSEVYTADLSSINITTQGVVDHGSLDQQLTLSASLGRQCFNITIANDDVVEEDEFFQLTITSIRRNSSNLYPYQETTPLATVTIIDDDLVCTPNCVNGLCKFPGVCQCFEGWIDEDCSREICQPPCVNGRCNVNTGYCDCSPGYTGASCSEDIMECKDENGGCDQICIDFPGGYSCSCKAGFTQLTSDGSSCSEICQPPCVNGRCNVITGLCDCSPGYTGASCGEVIGYCDEDNGGCDQICTDFPGGYSCSCRAGYSLLTSDGTSCMDMDECGEGSHDCSQICVNTPGSYYCNCQRGFQLANSTHCGDVNECELFPNGFCSQVCVNTDGSFRCECREGYRLFGSSFCTDIDECSEGIDKCNKSGPTPARCINTEGSYSCTCDEHVGYRLATDNITCKDVDECEENIHVCTEICVNTPGSYSCSCTEGYVLQDDEISCSDIDECIIMNGGCQHSCTNELGSFSCSCDKGYRLLDDGLQCEAPLNGSMECNRQTVGGTCRFTCDEGYTLRGSDSRTCLPSLQWREPPAICDPPMCPHLTPPDDGFVLFPCTREEGHLCRVVCAHGYSLEGPSNQTCRKDNTSSLVWSDGPQCVESGLCDPNPCLNGGFCIEAGTEFRCVCNGTATGYGGQTCGAVIVHFLPIPPVTDGLFIPIVLYTTVTEFPDKLLMV